MRELLQVVERDVAPATLHVSDKSAMESRFVSQCLLAPLQLLTQLHQIQGEQLPGGQWFRFR